MEMHIWLWLSSLEALQTVISTRRVAPLPKKEVLPGCSVLFYRDDVCAKQGSGLQGHRNCVLLSLSWCPTADNPLCWESSGDISGWDAMGTCLLLLQLYSLTLNATAGPEIREQKTHLRGHTVRKTGDKSHLSLALKSLETTFLRGGVAYEGVSKDRCNHSILLQTPPGASSHVLMGSMGLHYLTTTIPHR